MQITKDSVVSFHYSVSDQEGNVLEDNFKDEAITYLHGHNGILAGLENALENLESEAEVSVTLPPEEAFGERQDDAEQRVPVKHLAGAKKWKPGMIASVNTQHGPRQVTIIKAGHTMATVDTNHPYAGKTVTFQLKVKEVRSATQEELTHGHAHGPGGHQH